MDYLHGLWLWDGPSIAVLCILPCSKTNIPLEKKSKQEGMIIRKKQWRLQQLEEGYEVPETPLNSVIVPSGADVPFEHRRMRGEKRKGNVYAARSRPHRTANGINSLQLVI